METDAALPRLKKINQVAKSQVSLLLRQSF